MATITQLCKQYNIAKDVLQLFIYTCLKDSQLEKMDDKDFNEEESKILASCICFHSLGFDLNTIKTYVMLEESIEDTRKERIAILQRQRDHELAVLHQTKKKSDCIERILAEVQHKKN